MKYRLLCEIKDLGHIEWLLGRAFYAGFDFLQKLTDLLMLVNDPKTPHSLVVETR